MLLAISDIHALLNSAHIHRFYLRLPQFNNKKNNAPAKHHQHQGNTHDGHYCSDSVVLRRGVNSSASLLCGGTVQAVWGVELRDCQFTWIWSNEVFGSINSDLALEVGQFSFQ